MVNNMAHTNLPHTFYLSLLKFLLQNKHELVELSSHAGLTTMQAFTLLLTDNQHPKSMNVFRKLYDCDASNITGIVDGLESKGLVARADHPTDRRVKVIRLLPAGKALKTEITRKLARANGSLLDALDDEELDQFVHIIEKLTRVKDNLTAPVA
jgi:DNA-binding MarR family transcriptional regulator